MMCCNFATTTLAVVVKQAGARRCNKVPNIELYVYSVFSGTCMSDSVQHLVLLLYFFVCAGRKRANFLDESFLDLKKVGKKL